MKGLDTYTWVALIIVLIGGICWGLVGLFNFYLVTGILGMLLGRIVYIIVAIAALYLCYRIYAERSKPV